MKNWNIEILPKLAPPHRRALGYNLAGQCFALFWGSLLLDGGVLAGFMLVASLAYWSVSAAILLRRYSRLTRGDLTFFEYGFLVAMLVAMVLRPMVGSLLGH